MLNKRATGTICITSLVYIDATLSMILLLKKDIKTHQLWRNEEKQLHSIKILMIHGFIEYIGTVHRTLPNTVESPTAFH